MDFLSWYDWIQPSNPYASLFFGVIFTLIIGIIVWFDSKNIRTSLIAVITGFSITAIGVIILNTISYYG